jgi:RNA polymerase sigma factor (TIGR02999 family)
MRQLLVHEERCKLSLKRGGGRARQDIDHTDLAAPKPSEDLLALDEALADFAVTEPAAAQIVQLRYFGGLTIPEVAEVLHISARTANRHRAYARAWLHDRMLSTGNDPGAR